MKQKIKEKEVYIVVHQCVNGDEYDYPHFKPIQFFDKEGFCVREVGITINTH